MRLKPADLGARSFSGFLREIRRLAGNRWAFRYVRNMDSEGVRIYFQTKLDDRRPTMEMNLKGLV